MTIEIICGIMVAFLVLIWVAVKRDYRKTESYQDSIAYDADMYRDRSIRLDKEINRIIDEDNRTMTAQIIELNKRAEEIKTLKRQIAARKAADTKRAKRLGKCSANEYFLGYYATSENGDVDGRTEKTKSEAKRVFERDLGLVGKIQWDE